MRPFYVFVHIPKTAGTSVRVAAASHFGARHMLYDYGTQARQTSELVKDWVYARSDLAGFGRAVQEGDFRFLAGHFPLAKYREVFPEARFLTWLRHPVDRVWSAYRHFHTRKGFEGSFRDFYSQRPHQNQQARMLGKDLELLDFIGITERFRRSLLVLSTGLGLTLKQVRANQDPDGDRPAPSDEDREAVLELNQVDMALYLQAEQRLLDAPFDAPPGRRPGLLRRLVGG